jgi:hypothetical protein
MGREGGLNILLGTWVECKKPPIQGQGGFKPCPEKHTAEIKG